MHTHAYAFIAKWMSIDDGDDGASVLILYMYIGSLTTVGT